MRIFWGITSIIVMLGIVAIVTAHFFVKYVAPPKPVNQAVIEWKSE